MAQGNIIIEIKGAKALRDLVERLERAVEEVKKIERPLCGDVHIHETVDPEKMRDALSGVRRVKSDGIPW